MNDNDDIRYSKAEDRPPWELSPGGQFREWFSCRKVDDTTAGYCREVEEHKKARVKAQTYRSASHARLQIQREEAQKRLAREQQAAKQRMAEDRVRIQADPERKSAPPADARAARYTYAEPDPRRAAPPKRPAQKRTVPPVNRKGRRNTSVPVIAIVVLISALIGFISEHGTDEINIKLPDIIGERVTEAEAPTERERDSDRNDDVFGRRYGQDDIPWDDILPDADEDAIQQSSIPRAAAGTVPLEIHSAEGLEPLSLQELYERCAPTTVSVRVYDDANGGGTGTGIILTEDGYVLTCAHVVAGGTRCTITTFDNETYDALLVGSDPQSDLAVLKVEASGLTAAQFGDSDELTVGDGVVAIGDPLGTELRGTMTDGIVSAINRNVTVKSYPMTLIQTTAPLNAGNSGGPLINLYGQVVGVNNMKMISNTVTVEGLGFAVPTTVIREILPVLTAEGKVSRAVLGITCYEIDEEMQKNMDLPATGLRVASIKKGSKAEAGGLKLGDYIQAVDGVEVKTVIEVREKLAATGIDGEVTLTVYRWDDEKESGETLELTITLVDQAELN